MLTAYLIIAVALGLQLSMATVATASQVESGPYIDADGVTRTRTVTGTLNPTASRLEQKIVSDGAIRMTGKEVKDYLANKTQQWSNGGAYYAGDGSLEFIWENKEFIDYTWSVRDDGTVCIDNPEGFTTSCSLYFRYDNSVWTVVTEVFGEAQDFFGGPDTLLQGKQLSELEPWDPALSGN